MSIEFRSAYWDDLTAREAFKSFIKGIHGLDFSQWESKGYWDSAYIPFSFFKNGQIISSISIYLLEAVIQGHRTKLAQISGVGTLENYRKRGLSRELTNLGINWAKDRHSGIFLFADEEAIPYYQKCGFSPLKESQEFLTIKPVKAKNSLIQVNPSNQDDLDKIYKYAVSRTPVSDIFSVWGSKLLMFHALYTMREKMFEIPELNCLVFFDQEDAVINVYDIIGECIPSLKDLHPYISSGTEREIIFHFHTDKLGIENVETRRLDGNHPFTKGKFPHTAPVFPYTSRA